MHAVKKVKDVPSRSRFNWSSKCVGDVMKRDCVTIQENEDLKDAIISFLKYDLTGVPVVDGDGKLTGFLSMKDCLSYVPELIEGQSHLPIGISVKEVMTPETHSLFPETSLEEAFQSFLNQWFHVYPVIDRDRRFIGLLSRHHLLAAAIES